MTDIQYSLQKSVSGFFPKNSDRFEFNDDPIRVLKRTVKPGLPVAIVDDHNEALSHWHKAMRRGLLPLTCCTLMHVDAHPDLSFPADVNAEICYAPELKESISISDFILPCLYTKQITSMVWVKPEWSEGFPHAPHNTPSTFTVGKSPSTNSLGIDFVDMYFIEDKLYCEKDKLEHPTDVDLLFYTLFSEHSMKSQLLNLSLEQTTSCLCKPFPISNYVILDIDLDFFCTSNPFLDNLHQAGFSPESVALIQRIFSTLRATVAKFSIEELKADHRCFKGFIEGSYELAESVITLKRTHKEGQRVYAQLLALFSPSSLYPDSQKMSQDCIWEQWQTLLFSLSTSQLETLKEYGELTSLPHHRSSPREVGSLIAALRAALQHTGLPRPTIITIARSVEDEYTPPADVDAIQDSVLEMLQGLYGQLKVEQFY
eukprot:GCRY01001007.1.p1 GENE.GCRY01001007.1~~GCRY01001007.1.p1  ORF type:complete len:429 (-),score=58.45 GCRY01001007.1:8-1294(-)